VIANMGIFTGGRDSGDDPLILHASPVDQTNAVWPLRRFREYPRYGTIYKVMRLREAFRTPTGG
jgi:hypothetical protein